MIPDTVQNTLGHQILGRKETVLLLEGQVGTVSRLGRDRRLAQLFWGGCL